jgi:hypothetical protein
MKLRFALFYHSLLSDWNHGNAHFLRGIVSELLAQGHLLRVYEPEDGWSRENLVRDYGPDAIIALLGAHGPGQAGDGGTEPAPERQLRGIHLQARRRLAPRRTAIAR